jgi:hypothetical protein
MAKKKLYALLFFGCMSGFAWIGFNYFSKKETGKHPPSFCIIKNVTSLPCPACGSTRSVMSLSEGNLKAALHWNPLGLLLAIVMLIVPLWIVYDLAQKKQSLMNTYVQAEIVLRKKIVYLPLLFLVTLNWIWNIFKGL